jgi:alpha-galactosidase
VAGVNHFPVVCELDVDGTDGFALLADMVEELGGLDALRPHPGRPEAEPFTKLNFAHRHLLKLSLLERFGALPAAGDRHLAEFLPSILTEESGWGESWGIALTPNSRREEAQAEYVTNVDAVLAGTEDLKTWESGEMVAPAIDSILTGNRRELPLNIPNAGQVPDVPMDAVVEAMCVVDGEGIRGRDVARPPAPLAEILRRTVAVQELTVEAAVRGDRELARAAFDLDSLAGRGDLRNTDAMVDELLEGTAKWLPHMALGAR